MRKEGGKILARKLMGKEEKEIDGNALVSMNMFSFTPELFNLLTEKGEEFLAKNPSESDEFLLPDAISDLIGENRVKVKVISCTAKWFGVTYREDLEGVYESIKKLKNDKIYLEKLWA